MRFNLIQARFVVPEPQKKSKTVSFSFIIGIDKFTSRFITNLQKLEKPKPMENDSFSQEIKFCESLYLNLVYYLSKIKLSCCFSKQKIHLIKEAKKEYLKMINFSCIFPKFSIYDFFLTMILNEDQIIVMKNQALGLNTIK